ncbi:MAG: hypothetical protein HOL51_23200 [Gemmatimonadetes bacterium]|nr:hypothetical protein [Gemmatimonadota bacterium]MBT5329031.1 hypothetical protein [Gemmatimonadota bacterium]MBT6623789.1 hypothetical protein [Gemmatimonadota bacterium]MBT6904425.1 hypothetical protein [Gemmatimonadota bacterium]MBT7418031.1 hypothetical protein [Gemmatimonadota bacterium]
MISRPCRASSAVISPRMSAKLALATAPGRRRQRQRLCTARLIRRILLSLA